MEILRGSLIYYVSASTRATFNVMASSVANILCEVRLFVQF